MLIINYEVLYMPSGEWSFIHEWMLYEYMINKFNEGTLRLRWVVKSGKLNLKSEYVRVEALGSITNTEFPDINEIKLEKQSFYRVAEVKFITSKFRYHLEKIRKKYDDFVSNNGCIIVLAHDEMPKKLIEELDVYELEQDDFISYIRENLIRLLNRQMHKSSYNKIWVMYQGPNFNNGTDEVPPARRSCRWCPSNNLNRFDLGVGDTVLFIKTKGIRKQDIKTRYDEWILNEIFLSKVILSITSRNHYCQIKGLSEKDILWYDETEKGKSDSKLTKRKKKGKNEFRWKRVFEFNKQDEFTDINIYFSEFPETLNNFKKVCELVFSQNIAIEISIDEYVSLFQYISKKYINNDKKQIL